MSTEAMLILISLVIIVSYILDIVSSRTRVPPIIFMLLAGITLRAASNIAGAKAFDVAGILPAIGALGLILIVLEAGLDLELDRNKLPIIRSSFYAALLSLIITAAAATVFFVIVFGAAARTCMINAIPFSIISSAIAIPGVRYISGEKREFAIYESSFSDIMGILAFNMALYNESYSPGVFISFGVEIVGTVAMSVALAMGLTLMIEKIDHKVKHLPVFSVLLLAYAVSKSLHFSPLILVLIFGLMLNNFNLVIRGNMVKYLDAGKLRQETDAFKSIISETTFVVKIFFFLFLGYSVNYSDLIAPGLLAYYVLPLLALIYAVRLPVLHRFARSGLVPLVYVAPRGLITILLFMSIPPELRIDGIDDGLMVWIILGTSAIMASGVMMSGRGKPNSTDPDFLRSFKPSIP